MLTLARPGFDLGYGRNAEMKDHCKEARSQRRSGTGCFFLPEVHSYKMIRLEERVECSLRAYRVSRWHVRVDRMP